MRLPVPVLAMLGLLLQANIACSGEITLDEAVSQARQKYHGRVISADTRRRNDGQQTHNIRILTPDGRVRRYQVESRPERRRPPAGR